MSTLTAFQLAAMLFCSAIWTFQAWKLLAQYFEFPTVASIKIERPSDVDLPSITICIPSMVSRKKLESWHNLTNPTVPFNAEKALEEVKNLSTSQLFKLSISYKDFIGGCRYWQAKNESDSWRNCFEESSVLRSMEINGKCFTIFSSLIYYHENETTKIFKVNPKKVGHPDPDGLVLKMNITIPDEDDLVDAHDNNIWLTMHSPFYVSSYESWKISIRGGKFINY